MSGFRSILAATDFSHDARHAVDRAAAIAADIGVDTLVLHVLETSLIDRIVGGTAEVEKALADAEKRTREAAVKAGRRFGCSVTGEVRTGAVVDAILDAAAGFGLVVLGARGIHRMRELAVGTTGQRLLRKTKKPVLIVRRKVTGRYRNVLAGIDFSSWSRKALEFASAAAPSARIRALHAFEAPLEAKMRNVRVGNTMTDEYVAGVRAATASALEKFAAGLAASVAGVEWCVEQGFPPTVLKDKVREWDIDLIVVGRHGKSPAEEFFLGSVTEHIIAEADCDVLVVQ